MGSKMAEQFADSYGSFDFSAVYSSSMKRAVATARPACAKLGVQPEVRSELREIGYGAWEGMTIPEVKSKYGADYESWLNDPGTVAPTGGETAIQVADRALKVVGEIQDKFATGNVLIVSHKATIRVIISSLIGIDPGQYRYRLGCPVCSLSIVEFGPRGPMLKRMADVAHLSPELRALEGS
jgi:probable phosphoglycerate mutase